jgi:hypothetical protein
LAPYFADRDVPFYAFDKPHDKAGRSAEEDVRLLDGYYDALDRDGMGELVELLERKHVERVEELKSMPRRTLDSVWWPFTQHGLVRLAMVPGDVPCAGVRDPELTQRWSCTDQQGIGRHGRRLGQGGLL